MKIFVVMPFNEDFDDVYYIIRESAQTVAKERKVIIEVLRADEITTTGRITLQVNEAISASDLVIADITGNNPNVMYEVGYAHALNKSVVMLNQSVHDASFDIKDFRQMSYERNRLLRDCKPRLVTAIASLLSSEQTNVPASEESSNENDVPLKPLTTVKYPGQKLVYELQQLNLEMQLARKTGDAASFAAIGKNVRSILDTVTVVGRLPEDDSRNSAAVSGNCAVELERGEEYDLAESVFGRAITLFPNHAGLRLQYADFLFDRGREGEAKAEFERGKELDPEDRRIASLKSKFGLYDPGAGAALKAFFENDPASKQKALQYIGYLLRMPENKEDFIFACELWERNCVGAEKLFPKRILADFLAPQADPKYFNRAIILYIELLESTEMSSQEKHDVLHNIATLYWKKDDRDNAKKAWVEAYNIDPKDTAVKTSFSEALSRLGDLENARRVVRGEPLQGFDEPAD